jgi:hypothetical protein
MKTARISRGGQIQVPADIRRRWQTESVLLEDQGEAMVIRPLPADPIGAARGSLRGPGPSTDEARAILRREEAAAEDRRRGR